MKPHVDTISLGVASAPEDAERAERIGVSTLWFGEMGADALDGVLAAAVSRPRVEFGTAVTGALVRNPMECAYRIADIQRLTGGPIRFGIGAQARQVVKHQYGAAPASALDKLIEFRRAVLAIWEAWKRGESPQFRGMHYRHVYTPEPCIPPDLTPAPRILLGATRARARAIAAQQFDGLVTHPCTPLRYLRDVIAPEFRASTPPDAAGSAPELVALTMLVCVANEASYERYLEEMRWRIWYWAAAGVHKTAFEFLGLDGVTRAAAQAVRRRDPSRIKQFITDEVVEEFCCIADVDDVGLRVSRDLAGTADRVVVLFDEDLSIDDARRLVKHAGSCSPT